MVKAHEEEVTESSSADMDRVQTEVDGVAVPKRGVIFKCDNLWNYKIICLGCSSSVKSMMTVLSMIIERVMNIQM